MASETWTYDEDTREYRNDETGEVLTLAALLALREEFITRRRGRVVRLAERLAEDELTLAEWEERMRAEIKTIWGAQYALGRGGRNAMSDGDWTAAGELVREQWQFLNGFSVALAAGALTQAQTAARAQLYLNGSVHAFERGRAAAFGQLVLPAYPGDGGTPCRSNCKCYWDIRETADEWHAFWRLSVAEHCEGCLVRASTYNPFVAAKTLRVVESHHAA